MQAVISILICVLVTLAARVQSSPACDGDDWRFSPHTMKCYKLFNTKTTWPMAEFKCVYQGAHHLSVHDVNDNSFVSELAKQAGVIWLGAAQFGASKDYIWSDLTPFSFEHWKDNHRPNYHKGRKCTKMDGMTGEWLQSCCKVPAAFICQKPALRLPGPIIEEPLPSTDPESQSQQLSDFKLRAARLR